jgi:membrane-associated protein
VDLVYDLFRDYGLWVLLPIVFFGQMGIPLGSMFFLAWYGSTLFSLEYFGFTVLMVVIATSAGDLAAYGVGRQYSKPFQNFTRRHHRINQQVRRGRYLIDRYGGAMIFFSRFLISGLGPVINYLVGSDRYKSKPFLIWVIAGETLYALQCVGLGYLLRDTWEYMLVLISDVGWLALLVVIGVWLALSLVKVARRPG